MRLFYIAAIIITLLCLINNNYVNAEVDKKDLKKKSDLDSSKLFNLTSYYTDITWQLDESNKISTDQLLNNTVKSRLLCKMLYNVFTISTYQN
ncbi:hypothetical protein GQX32_08035 [Staphylococcus aureus]|nr:hypothetical protein W305_00978 [Staphylococcus aureus DAR5872]EYR55083.1 hypothetical protein W306_00910 [Staphylococcus aureus DAR5871]NGR61447.1 hypothetical protein [Staphylococcus aureus]NGS30855.1 hypothetical protein [Staphylococcus aureus]NUX20659.1 hypothetical protein [Staphylococcus aureus]